MREVSALVLGAGIRTPARGFAPARTRALRTDGTAAEWDLEAMPTPRKRNAFDLFVDALLHPVRFR
jgi:hypothetical protein